MYKLSFSCRKGTIWKRGFIKPQTISYTVSLKCNNDLDLDERVHLGNILSQLIKEYGGTVIVYDPKIELYVTGEFKFEESVIYFIKNLELEFHVNQK